MDGCDTHDECLERCADEVNEYTNNGDLDSPFPGGFTVGQELCLSAAEHGHTYAHFESVYGYANVCDGPWDYTGVQMQGMICCYDGHYHKCGE